MADDRLQTWTAEQAAEVLSSISLASPQPTYGRTVTIDIPLDESIHQQELPLRTRVEAVHTVYKRREPIRRDSLKRREALLKGKEGSRRRQRWENDRLLSNPHAEPPLPSDFEVPIQPAQHVPYFLAPLWDAEYSKVSERRAAAKAAAKPKGEEAAAQKMTQDLRAKLKRARGAKGLLEDLEKEVRGFVQQWDEKQRQLEAEGFIDLDSSDDEVVFVGRNASASSAAVVADKLAGKQQRREIRRDKLIFESLVDDHGASFGRYLVHCIATYYGLKTWSVTTGDPARREAYVGFDELPARQHLPRPLWLVV